MGLKFEIKHKDPQTKARAGKITTDHGEIQTPIFMPVGTAGTVKAVHQRELKEDINADIILGNTYHLYLRPGTEILEKAGGLHKFNGWDRPILTDSGGYQVFSLAQTRKIKEEGVTFRSHIDGSKHLFTPERVMDIQRSIGADIIMAFDECPPYPSDYTYAKNSMQLTHRWLQRCVDRLDETVPLYGHHQALFPIVQGSTYKDLRTQSAEKIASFEREGNAIGGLSVGEPAEMMYEFTELCCDILPEDKPRYLMGVGTPANILENIALGVDMLDCVMPTRQARHGHVFTTQGIMNLKNKKWEDDFEPIDATLGGYASTFYSRSYLRHMFKANEALAGMVASVHNLTFYLWLVREARQHIIDGDFREWKNAIIPTLMQRL
ncbi:tRNA guanosine(34) transglycosylase Tgt [Flammeovirga pectinis]|uniref:Queuine tRNA-ribosyltransferase n=1 Tax=Flammeovirga pectinis TaxID=2494373 RepID=A0A3Q9FPA0_9BACT|nr:tRNA guanosine(34) transglycosylase Tgt [Flammeovirga pectinis]AZQ62800.1 tRNA guanosine(34) transglycosylase Tgt [Flammeovirga pectinis]